MHTTLIDARDLLTRLLSPPEKAPDLVLIEASFDLADADAGERSYREGHLPGAHYLHLERDLSGVKTGHNGRHPLPERDAFALVIGRLGIRPSTHVIAYDRQQSMPAARVWWMLRWLGHEAVAVLDGGVGAWQDAGGALSEEVPPLGPALPYPDRPGLVRTIDADGVLAGLGRLRVLDARAPERFRGEVEPLDAAAGHIPGALNRFYKDNLTPDGRFKPAQQLRAEFEPLLAASPEEPMIHQCGSGVSACHNLLAMEVAGLTGSVLYPGSWSEWSADPARPVARG